MTSKTTLLVLLSAGLLLAAAPAPELQLKERDHKALGKEVKAYFDAKTESEGILEAFGDVTDAIDKQQKRLKKVPLLSLVEDWEQIFYEARAAGYSERGLRKGKVDERSYETPSGADVHYALWLPKAYSSKKGPYPLVITLPASGQKPEDHLDEDWADPVQRETAVVLAPRMPSDVAVWGSFDPTSEAGLDGVTTVMFALSAAIEELAVDMNRVYLCAKGEEAIGAALATAGTFPQRFAGVIARGTAPAGSAANFRHIPMLFVDGGDAAKAFAEKATELGFADCVADGTKSEADLWAWMAERRRNAYPAKVSFFPASPYSTSAYWLDTGDVNVEEAPSIEAEVDRESNHITITAENVTTVRLSFNDLLVDMEKPVTVVVNGIEHQVDLARNARVMIDSIYQRGDWGRVFTAAMPFDVTAKSN